MTRVAATARSHDLESGAGTLLLDDGTIVTYSAAAFDAGGLRLLRSGQRVRLHRDADGTVTAITLPSFPAP